MCKFVVFANLKDGRGVVCAVKREYDSREDAEAAGARLAKKVSKVYVGKVKG